MNDTAETEFWLQLGTFYRDSLPPQTFKTF